MTTLQSGTTQASKVAVVLFDSYCKADLEPIENG